jgi:hypothetical protein
MILTKNEVLNELMQDIKNVKNKLNQKQYEKLLDNFYKNLGGLGVEFYNKRKSLK